jgi:hypothetical protein
MHEKAEELKRKAEEDAHRKREIEEAEAKAH